MPPDPEVQFLQIDEINLAYRQMNPKGEKTLVLLHGLAESSAFFWRPLFDQFADSYHIIAFDLLGHGDTSAPAQSYHPDYQAKLLYSALRALGIERFSFITHSIGGPVALAFTRQYPEQVESLILYSVPVSRGFLKTVLELMREVSILSLLPGFPLIFPFSGHVMGVLPKAMQRLIYKLTFWQWRIPYPNGSVDTPTFKAEMITQAARTSGPGLERTVRDNFLFASQIDILPTITQPVLFIKGEHDFILSEKMAQNYCNLLPNARLIVIPKTSHISLLDRPDVFIQLVDTFIQTGNIPATV